MALSGSFNYVVTASGVIQGALEKLGVVTAGESVDSDDESLMLRELNGLVKQWGTPGDAATGMPVWLRKLVTLYLDKAQRVYTLGPSGDNATEDHHRTTLSAAEAASQTTLSITSTSGMANSDIIGIVLDTGYIQWTTVTSFVANTSVLVGTGLSSGASAGNAVYYYTPSSEGVDSIGFRALDILTAVLNDENEQDTPVSIFKRQDSAEFDSVPDKTSQEDPYALFFEPQLLTGTITLPRAASDASKVLKLRVLSPVDDLDNTTDSLNFPPEWNMALQWELAKRACPSFKADWTNMHQENWMQATGIARATYARGFEAGFQAEGGDEDEGTL